MAVAFVVEQAGCESCAKLVASALSEVGAVDSVEVDEAADVAVVVLSGSGTRTEVDAALERASASGGHAYRVRPESWRSLD